jgi:hypothetical protein
MKQLCIHRQLTIALAFAAISLFARQPATRAQSERVLYLPVTTKAFAISEPLWAWTSDCAKTTNFEGETPDGGQIGQVARKLAFIAFIPGAQGRQYSYQWILDGDPNAVGPAVTREITDQDGFIASGILTFGENGACQDPQPPGRYQVRILLNGVLFHTASLTITP